MEGLASLLPLVGILLLFWFLIIRPSSRRQKEQTRMQAALNVGDEVMLSSGFYGTVVGLADDRLHVDLAPDTTVTVARQAVGSVVSRADDAEVGETPGESDHTPGPDDPDGAPGKGER